MFNEAPAEADEFPVADAVTLEAELLPERPKRNPRVASALGMQTQGANGEMLSNLHNAERMLRNAHGESLTLEYDEFTSRVLVQWFDTPRRDWTDTDAGRLQLMLQTKGLRTASKETAYTVADLVAKEHTVNAVRDMLERLVWDSTPRLTTWLSHAFGAPTTRYYLRAGRNWLISMVARAYQPGCQVDTMTVLEGPQGNAKSSAFRILAAPWFAELIADFESKDATQQLRGLWLAEFGELHKLNKGSVELAKQYITNRDDRYRPTYGRIEVSHPRQCVLVGTTNRNDWARDETGNRRFIPVECRTDIDLKWLAANRDQLFAEAVVAYRHGRFWWHWPRRETLDKQADRLAVDPWAEAIERNWRDAVHTDSTRREFVTVAELLANVLGVQVAAQNTALHQRVAAALRVLGFESGAQCRLGGIRVRPWYAPEESAIDSLLT